MSKVDSLSVIIPLAERGENLEEVFKDYYENIVKIGIEVEFVIVMSPGYESKAEEIKKSINENDKVKIILLNRNYGEAGLIKIGVEHSQSNYILTLAPYEQI